MTLDNPKKSDPWALSGISPQSPTPAPPPDFETAIRSRIDELESSIKQGVHSKGCKPWQLLAIATLHNRAESPLIRLPDTVLVRLLEFCDRVTVECLRRTSRTFLRLFPPAFVCNDTSFLYSENPIPGNAMPWPFSSLSLQPVEMGKELTQLLDRDAYCVDCNAARARQDWDARWRALFDTYIHCSCCEREHAACFFSAAQRRARSPICIGYEGHYRLCEHVTLTWEQLVQEADRHKLDQRYHGVTQCHHESHDRPCAARGSSLSGNLTRDILQRGWQSIAKKWASCTARDRCQACEQARSKCRCGCPTVSLKWIRPDWMRLYIDAHAHIPLHAPQAGGMAPDVDALREGLRDHYEDVGRFVCPAPDYGNMIGSSICGPALCHCLNYPGLDSMGWERPPTDYSGGCPCKTQPAKSFENSSYTARGSGMISPRGTCTDPLSYLKGFCYQRMSPLHRGCEIVSGTQCSKGDTACVIASHTTAVDLFLRSQYPRLIMRYAWLQLMEPESYGLTEDDDSKNVFWCYDKDCKNYFRQVSVARLAVGGWKNHHMRDWFEDPLWRRGSYYGSGLG